MPEPRIKRYALVPSAGEDGVRRFHLARVAGDKGSLPAAARLERMEEIARADPLWDYAYTQGVREGETDSS